MNTALNIRDVGAEIKTALIARAEAEGKPMAEIAKTILADALGVQPETPAARWKRENAAGIAAYNKRSRDISRRMQAISAVPIPQFGDEE